jgi:endonuclease/exonuclease/phosphatase family metal-dependent hydrolase
LVFSLASAGILLSRGFGQSSAAAASTGDVTILEWNTKGDAPGAEGIARLALAQKADVVALPETTLITGKQVAVLMKAEGRPMWVYSLAYDYISKSRSTTLLISSSLGAYTATTVSRTTSVLPTVIAKPKTSGAPTIIAVHAVAPKPNFMRNWRNDLSTLSGLCSGENTIMIGDFNSTLDSLAHYSTTAGRDFGECRDAGAARGAAAVGTWPTNIPSILGAQIDHVMTTSAWKASSMRVITDEDAAGSDHRPIVVTLSPTH